MGRGEWGRRRGGGGYLPTTHNQKTGTSLLPLRVRCEQEKGGLGVIGHLVKSVYQSTGG